MKLLDGFPPGLEPSDAFDGDLEPPRKPKPFPPPPPFPDDDDDDEDDELFGGLGGCPLLSSLGVATRLDFELD